MPIEPRTPALVRFGLFEVDLSARELRKQGVRLKVQEQPFRVLTALIERPGEVVTREELRAQIWSEDTFVDFDNSLNTSVNKLREALGDSADSPRFIETLPRRGYRFIAPLEKKIEENEHSSATGKSHPRGWKLWTAVAVVLAALAAGFTWQKNWARRISEKDTIVLADFVNTTGDAVFDDALKQGLRVQLEQSPFLNILSDEQASRALSSMGRQRGERLTTELAREVCLRAGSKAMLTGSISSLGTHYVIGLAAMNCQSGESLGNEQVEADSRERVLRAVGDAATRIRKKLGESLSSVQKYGASIEEATTPSLDALRAYSLGLKMFLTKGNDEALPFFQRAVEFDPTFAMAYSRIANMHANLGEPTQAAENMRKAYELRQNVSERERLYIEAHYYDIVTGEIEKAARVYELYKQLYPREPAPYDNLAGAYALLGRNEQAVQAGRQLVLLDPENQDAYTTLGAIYIRLDRLEEAEKLFQQAERRKLEGEDLLWCHYQVAFLRNNAEEMKRFVAMNSSKQSTHDLVGIEGIREAQHGRLKRARELWRRAKGSAMNVDAREPASVIEAAAGLIEAYFGNSDRARTDVEAALKTSFNRASRRISALALALAGDASEGETVSESLNSEWPLDTIVQHYWMPTVRAAIALDRHTPEKAIEWLQNMGSFELCPDGQMDPVYLRGSAYLYLGNGRAAATEFQKILDHPGLVLENPSGVLARLGMARAYRSMGDFRKARIAYKDFLGQFEEADPDIPILQQAKAEYAKLE